MCCVGHDRPVLRDLVNNVVTDQWYYLGLQLLEPKYENELNIIEGDAKNDVKTCCRKMFSKWLNTDKLASWDKVIEALTVIGLNSLANNVKQLLQQGECVLRDSWLSVGINRFLNGEILYMLYLRNIRVLIFGV